MWAAAAVLNAGAELAIAPDAAQRRLSDYSSLIARRR
jgi:hypothetical protein